MPGWVEHPRLMLKVERTDCARQLLLYFYGTDSINLPSSRYKLNIWDVGGQKSLRSYWRNYFEATDGLIWVVDSADKRRLVDCKGELHSLLVEEVRDVQVFLSLEDNTSWIVLLSHIAFPILSSVIIRVFDSMFPRKRQ